MTLALFFQDFPKNVAGLLQHGSRHLNPRWKHTPALSKVLRCAESLVNVDRFRMGWEWLGVSEFCPIVYSLIWDLEISRSLSELRRIRLFSQDEAAMGIRRYVNGGASFSSLETASQVQIAMFATWIMKLGKDSALKLETIPCWRNSLESSVDLSLAGSRWDSCSSCAGKSVDMSALQAQGCVFM